MHLAHAGGDSNMPAQHEEEIALSAPSTDPQQHPDFLVASFAPPSPDPFVPLPLTTLHLNDAGEAPTNSNEEFLGGAPNFRQLASEGDALLPDEDVEFDELTAANALGHRIRSA